MTKMCTYKPSKPFYPRSDIQVKSLISLSSGSNLPFVLELQHLTKKNLISAFTLDLIYYSKIIWR